MDGNHRSLVQKQLTWWGHEMEMLSALLALCEEKALVTVFNLNTLFNKLLRCQWYEMSWYSWCHVTSLWCELTKVTPDSKVHGAHLGTTGPRWAPCWPHEPCYLGPHTSPSWVSHVLSNCENIGNDWQCHPTGLLFISHAQFCSLQTMKLCHTSNPAVTQSWPCQTSLNWAENERKATSVWIFCFK